MLVLSLFYLANYQKNPFGTEANNKETQNRNLPTSNVRSGASVEIFFCGAHETDSTSKYV